MRLSLLLPAFLFACSGPSPRLDGGPVGPTIANVSPTSGPLGGGTEVTITGAQFAAGATVRFGDALGLQVIVANESRLTVRTPAVTMAGRVSVTVKNPDGTTGNLDDGYTFEAPATEAIAQAIVMNPLESVRRSNDALVTLAISAQVEVGAVTKGIGRGAGVRAQVGSAPAAMRPPLETDFSWVEASYAGDADGAIIGDLARDLYGGQVSVAGASTTSVQYWLAARFSLDDGRTWRLADADGLANGIQVDRLPRVTVEPPTIGSCRLGGRPPSPTPPTVTVRENTPGPWVFAQVFVPGRTEAMGPGAGIRGQLGYGPMGTPPSAWTWVDAQYAVDVGVSDEYQARVENLVAGTYRFAFRFSLEGRPPVLCDHDGNDTSTPDGFTVEQTGTLVVEPSQIDSCTLLSPATATALAGAQGPIVVGRVTALGFTDAPDAGSLGPLAMELGVGPVSDDPSQNSWTWTPAAFERPGPQGTAEYRALLPATPAGRFAYAFRARLSAAGGATYCDLDGSTNGFSLTQAGVLTVASVSFSECRLQSPSSLTSYEGIPTNVVYGQVFAPGVTQTSPDGGPPSGVQGQLGFGALDSDPQAADAGWTWTPAAFNIAVPGNGVEYQARLTAPAPGRYAYAYRFRFQSGAWTYCDLDGASNRYQASQQGRLTVLPVDVDECVVQTTSVESLPNVSLPAPFLARVSVPTVTDVMGPGQNVSVDIGYGPLGSVPSTWTTWTAATFDSDAMRFDQYRAVFPAPASVGLFDVAFRARVGNRPFVYCDRDGVPNGYSSAQAARLSVANALFQACQLTTPSAFTVASGSPLRVEVNVAATGTSGMGQAPHIRAQIGMGPRDDASLSALWGWAEASYVGDANGRDVYGLTTNPSYTGARAVSARVSTNNGVSWAYCDLNGSDINGYESTQQYNVEVTGHQSIQFCNTQFPTTVSIDAGTTRIYGQVYQPGITPSSSASLLAQFGLGERDQEPALAWHWSEAPFFGIARGNNNEYAVDYRPDGGASNYAFRYSRDDGGSWCYGDLDGNGANGAGQGWDGFRGHLGGGAVNVGQVTP